MDGERSLTGPKLGGPVSTAWNAGQTSLLLPGGSILFVSPAWAYWAYWGCRGMQSSSTTGGFDACSCALEGKETLLGEILQHAPQQEAVGRLSITLPRRSA